MGNRSGAALSDYQLRQLAAASGVPIPRIYEIYGAYRYYSMPFFGLGRRGYVKMYRNYNPLYAGYAPEIADRAFAAFDRDRNGRLNFYEFLTSVLLAGGQPSGAMQVAQIYAPPVRPGWVTYPEATAYTNFLYRFYGKTNFYSSFFFNFFFFLKHQLHNHNLRLTPNKFGVNLDHKLMLVIYHEMITGSICVITRFFLNTFNNRINRGHNINHKYLITYHQLLNQLLFAKKFILWFINQLFNPFHLFNPLQLLNQFQFFNPYQ
jgi:hypothetical protein